jgi:hypothetical protein
MGQKAQIYPERGGKKAEKSFTQQEVNISTQMTRPINPSFNIALQQKWNWAQPVPKI